MKKIIKIISVLIVAIVISATVYVKTNSNNDTVKMQNKEALATKPPVTATCSSGSALCASITVYGLTDDYYMPKSN